MPAFIPVTLWLTDEEGAALTWQARRYQQTDETRVWAWVRPAMDEAVREWRAAQWETRRRKMTADAALAATVDAAVDK